MKTMLYDGQNEHDSCGVGLIARKDGRQSHELLQLAGQALCKVPHRGGQNALGIGDGGGINFDLSERFYRQLTGNSALTLGQFAVGNFFFPRDEATRAAAERFLHGIFAQHQLTILLQRTVPVDPNAVNAASAKAQLPICQYVLARPADIHDWDDFEHHLTCVLREIDAGGVNGDQFAGFYPLSLSARTQVYKGLLNSGEVLPYFVDLQDPAHEVSMLFFHTRFSTNTAPNPHYAQPFRHLAHNGELNTDRKNRISEQAVAAHNGQTLSFPTGQSDSARLDMTLTRRLAEEKLPLERAILQMMPPAWENDPSLPPDIRAMLNYFALSEEINDGPAGLVFSDGVRIGAALDRLGLRPMRTVETADYFVVCSEAGQIDFPPESVLRRGRIEAGGMLVYNLKTKTFSQSRDILQRMANDKDYPALLAAACVSLADLPAQTLADITDASDLNYTSRHIAYSLNQESFRFMLDPMLNTGAERVSAMGYGLAVNALTEAEGGMARYFSQRFAQVTNPPLDSIREADGMTLRVALGAKPFFAPQKSTQLQLDSPCLLPQELASIRAAREQLTVAEIATLYPFHDDEKANAQALENALHAVCDAVVAAARAGHGIIILDDSAVSRTQAVLPAVLVIAAVNRRLIATGLRFQTSLIYHTGQICSTHDVALLLGFGASAVCPATVYNRAREIYPPAEVPKAMQAFRKALHKALMKTMGKFGLCTVESYSGGGFFEPSFLNTADPKLRPHFPNMVSPLGGAGFADIARSAWEWHKSALQHENQEDIPLLGLFKERGAGAGHSFGQVAVRTYGEMTAEAISFAHEGISPDGERLHILPQDDSYLFQSHQKRTPAEIDRHQITPAYRQFVSEMTAERAARPAALRDVLSPPADFQSAVSKEDFLALLRSFHPDNPAFPVRNLRMIRQNEAPRTGFRQWLRRLFGDEIALENPAYARLVVIFGDGERFAKDQSERHNAFAAALNEHFAGSIHARGRKNAVWVQFNGAAGEFFARLRECPAQKNLRDIQPAHEITAAFATGAMSHGALLEKAHEAVALGANMVGALSNSGEGGENSRRYGTLKASRIKQIASGRFGVWAGYLADPCLEELEIKIGQGAKPGEGGQLPAHKVTVEIAAARGGVPGVELVSPPPHHDTYSIEDLGQLIHDAKAARVRVVVKLVSSEGIGTIAVGVAKAGADVINVAGNTGGTGAAQVTSLKHSGRIPELGLAEVHQALAENGLRDKVILRCSGAHQTGLDVIRSCMLGGDSFEFGTTALMMLKCVMAKNCNIKCPVGLTTDHEVFDGDPRALAQYLMNVAHDVREWLAKLGFNSLRKLRGRSDLLYLLNHPNLLGSYHLAGFLRYTKEVRIANPIYVEADFGHDEGFWQEFTQRFARLGDDEMLLLDAGVLHNNHKTVGGQFSLDLERFLQHQASTEIAAHPKVITLTDGRRVLRDDTVTISSENSAGQSYGAFNNSGVTMVHQGTCNDGVGKSMTGGRIVIQNPGGGADENVLIGNFALFGATGGQLFVAGAAGDRFGVRNSGAVAVVEGVGDFACEYMTNGAIVNLAHFGKGFGNGMSGGVAYQYDPSGEIVQRASHDSVTVHPLAADDDLARGQEEALRTFLTRHAARTGSPRAENLLADWANSRQHFYFLLPRAWHKHHTAEAVAQNPRKNLLTELSKSLAGRFLRDMQHHYRTGAEFLAGKVPETAAERAQLLIAAGVLWRANEQVTARGVGDIADAAKRLILNDDRPLLEQLEKDMATALAAYSDEALATLVADQRVRDYQRALALRESFDSDALGTTTWILTRCRANRAALQQFPPLATLLAGHFSAAMAEAVAQLEE